ncbi:MAG: hypothetical protein CL949_12760 [Erythrobacter sp.]|mgnify:CR=1 FL=1|nr:hypothetical protein [Erythrobacter sp.]|tara:strand:- start:177 stop:626 length:450 start_codon:yes stop_codon:yes gene_type:complete
MKIACITLWQPYASLLFASAPFAKVHETRTFPIPDKHMGELVGIHAAKRPIRTLDQELQSLAVDAFGEDFADTLPRGALVGLIRFNRWMSTDWAKPESDSDRVAGDWSPGRYAWRAEDHLKLSTPITLKGAQGWFWADVPEAEIGKALA